ncbi:hypothetical protein LZ31DRAFT_69628 [Colletotrichum somersetense]|nr:hypothetical protein LZ31DRAFT_69628 [Colletotrichum somersetense]
MALASQILGPVASDCAGVAICSAQPGLHKNKMHASYNEIVGGGGKEPKTRVRPRIFIETRRQTANGKRETASFSTPPSFSSSSLSRIALLPIQLLFPLVLISSCIHADGIRSIATNPSCRFWIPSLPSHDRHH